MQLRSLTLTAPERPDDHRFVFLKGKLLHIPTTLPCVTRGKPADD